MEFDFEYRTEHLGENQHFYREDGMCVNAVVAPGAAAGFAAPAVVPVAKALDTPVGGAPAA